jgi:hypothetical protein
MTVLPYPKEGSIINPKKYFIEIEYSQIVFFISF